MVKERSKNAERSQNAAKRRREEENKVLKELAEMLPIPSTVAKNIDKATIIRLTTAYLKLRRLFPKGIGIRWGKGSNTTFRDLGALCNQSLDGFVFILGENAKILYISEAASSHLGLPQLDFIGNSLFNFIHDLDHSDMKNLLCNPVPAFNCSSSSTRTNIEVPLDFILRMKCILAKRQAELAIDGHKIIHCRGYLKLKLKPKLDNVLSSEPVKLFYEVVGAVSFGQSVPSTPFADIKMNKGDFMFRTGFNMHFMYLEPRVVEIIGYEPTYLVNKSLYTFVHPCDNKQIQQAHILVIKKNQAITKYYRFLSPTGGWIWLQSFCIIVSSSKASRQQCILFYNQVISKCEYSEMVLHENVVKLKAKKGDYQTKKSCSQKNRKKVKTFFQESSSNSQDLMNNDLDQIEPSLPLISMPGMPFEINNSQNIPQNPANGLFESYLQSTFLNQTQRLVPNISAFSETIQHYGPIFTNAISSSNSTSPFKMNNYLDSGSINKSTNEMNAKYAKICGPNEPTHALNPVVHSKIYINYPEAVPGRSVTKRQINAASEDESPNYVEPISNNASKNYLENVESNIWTPVAKRFKANENSQVDFSITSSYTHNKKSIVNPIQTYRYSDALLHSAVNSVKLSDEHIDELFSHPNDEVYPTNNTMSSQSLNYSSGDDNYCISHRIHSCVLCDDSLSKNITNGNFRYPSDDLQKSLYSISFIQNSNISSATNLNYVQGLHTDTTFDLNGCIPFDAIQTPVTTNELRINNIRMSLTNSPLDLKSAMPFESIQTSMSANASNLNNKLDLVHTSTPYDFNCGLPLEPNQTSGTENTLNLNTVRNSVHTSTPFDFNSGSPFEPNQASLTEKASNQDNSRSVYSSTPVDFNHGSPLDENPKMMTSNTSSSSSVTMQSECFSSIDLSLTPSKSIDGINKKDIMSDTSSSNDLDASNFKSSISLTNTPSDLKSGIPSESIVTETESNLINMRNLVHTSALFDLNSGSPLPQNQTSLTAKLFNLDNSRSADTCMSVDFNHGSPLEENLTFTTTNSSSSSSVTMQSEGFSSIDLNSAPSESTDGINEKEIMSDIPISNDLDASNFNSSSSILTNYEHSSPSCESVDVLQQHSSFNSFSSTFCNIIDNQFLLPIMVVPETHTNMELDILNNN